MQEYYKILGLNNNASADEIKQAYKRRAKETHPDLNNGQDEESKKVVEAYEILSGKKNPPRQNENNNFHFDINDIFSNFSGFSDFFAQQNAQKNRPPSEDRDVNFQINLNVEDLKKGRHFSVKYKKSKDCHVCSGVGGKFKRKCQQCSGLVS